MATLNQLLKLQQQIEADEDKLEKKRARRSELITKLGLKKGSHKDRGENFVSVDGTPQRLWVSIWDEIELEALEF